MGRVERINKVIKYHDPKLFCLKDSDGKLSLYRKNWKWEPYKVGDDVIHFARPDHFFICSLTHNWKAAGSPVDWGLVPIVERLKAMDLWNRDIAGEVIEQEEKHSEMMSRERQSKNEDFLKEFRPQFARATSDINTSTLAKKDLRKIKEK